MKFFLIKSSSHSIHMNLHFILYFSYLPRRSSASESILETGFNIVILLIKCSASHRDASSLIKFFANELAFNDDNA